MASTLTIRNVSADTHRSRVRSTGGVDGTVILDALAADRDR